MFYYRLDLTYNGAGLFGWQKQKHWDTVQGEIEKVFHETFGEAYKHSMGASRTDTGVHALGQVMRITLKENYRPEDLHQLLNQKFPDSIHVKEVSRSNHGFKVIYLAQQKEYLYAFTNNEFESPSVSLTT